MPNLSRLWPGMAKIRALLVFTIMLCISLLCVQSTANSEDIWTPLPDGKLTVIPGSALDLSGLTPKRSPDDTARVIITPDATFALSSAPNQSLRFFCATMALGPNEGGYPDHARADLMAQTIRADGYNAVRVHLTEAMLMTGQHKDFDYNPQQLDRLYYLLAALKRQGLYLFVDMMGSWNGAYGDVPGHRWMKGYHDTITGSLVDGPDRQHWLEIVKTLWARTNPYTHLSTLKDPAVAGIILVNEGSPDFQLRHGVNPTLHTPDLSDPFHAWLLKKYGSEAGIVAAWGVPFVPHDQPGPNDISPGASDFQRFTFELMNDQVTWMRQRLSELGYDGPVTSFNDTPGFHNGAGKMDLSFVDMHQYADLNKGGAMVEPGTQIYGTRILDGKNLYLGRLAWSRQVGKPFTVTEYGMAFWDPWRYEVAPITAAYARLQGWDLISHFGTSVDLERPGTGNWQKMIVPFSVGRDPTLRAGETIAAFLYGRGDVTPATSQAILPIDLQAASTAPANKEMGWQATQLAFLTKVAVDYRPSDNAGRAPFKNILKLAPGSESEPIASLIERLKRMNLIENDDTSSAKHHYLSQNGQLYIDFDRKFFSVKTSGTIGLIGAESDQVQDKKIYLKIRKGEGAFFMSALGDGAIQTTNRYLVVVSGDSRNSGMTFQPGNERILANIGHFPALLKDMTVEFEDCRHTSDKGWSLYVLAASGARTAKVPLEYKSNGCVAATITLSQLGPKISPYFEYVADN